MGIGFEPMTSRLLDWQATTALIYCAIPLKSVCIVCSLNTSTNNIIIGTISNNIPTIVTDTKKKFLELTPVLFCISFNK